MALSFKLIIPDRTFQRQGGGRENKTSASGTVKPLNVQLVTNSSCPHGEIVCSQKYFYLGHYKGLMLRLP